MDIHRLLDGKWEDGTRPKDLFLHTIQKQPEQYAEVIIQGLSTKNRRIENGCAELASLVSEERPDLLYPHLELFLKNLDSKEKVIRWEAVCTLGNLAKADSGERILPAIPKLFAMLTDKSVVLQVHAVRALSKIAASHPKTANEIFQALWSATEAFPENRIGFIVESMDYFLPNRAMHELIRKQVSPFKAHELKVVASKALKILKKLDK